MRRWPNKGCNSYLRTGTPFGDLTAVDNLNLTVRGHDLRLPGPQWFRQDDDDPGLLGLLEPTQGVPRSGLDVATQADAIRPNGGPAGAQRAVRAPDAYDNLEF